ncbi:MAG: LysR family transcriptional regulator [Gammaproteobacteria bacterium]|nr:LysR family transcriptional regulator [Gammaproteobacteria bacterium]
MDITALKTFLEVAKVKHFGRAADNLCVTQSAVSARLKSLEDTLGAKLLVRERSNIHLSSDGEILLEYADSIVRNWEKATQVLKMSEGLNLQLSVAGLPGIWDMILQPWLTHVMAERDDVAFSAEVLSEDSLLTRLTNRTLDLAFVYDAPRGKFLNSRVFAELPLVLVSSERDQSLEDALSENYAFVDWGANFAVQHAKHFPDASFARLQTTQGRVAYEQIKARGGAAYLAKPMVKKAIKKKQLYKVIGAPVFNRAAYAVYHQKTDKTELIKSLLMVDIEL